MKFQIHATSDDVIITSPKGEVHNIATNGETLLVQKVHPASDDHSATISQ